MQIVMRDVPFEVEKVGSVMNFYHFSNLSGCSILYFGIWANDDMVQTVMRDVPVEVEKVGAICFRFCILSVVFAFLDGVDLKNGTMTIRCRL